MVGTITDDQKLQRLLTVLTGESFITGCAFAAVVIIGDLDALSFISGAFVSFFVSTVLWIVGREASMDCDSDKAAFRQASASLLCVFALPALVAASYAVYLS